MKHLKFSLSFGSGRQSAAKLATFMADFDMFQIEITKNYTATEWREDIKRVNFKIYEKKMIEYLFYFD
jgi:dynein heavy chain